MIRRSRTPTATAASTNSRSRIDRNSERTSRLTPIHENRPKITMTVVTVPLPRNLDATRITNSVGRLSITSTRRISRLSTRPPAKPEMAPTMVPMNTPIAMLVKPIRSDVREPLTTSVRTSRWRPPVSPIGWARLGPRPAADDLVGLRDVGEAERQQDRPDDRDQDQRDDQAEADEREPVLAELAPRELPLVERLEPDLVVLGRGRVGVDDLRGRGETGLLLDVLGHR